MTEVTGFIADNYELSPKADTASGYEAVIKSDGVAINFYAGNTNTPCITDHLLVSISMVSQYTPTITNVLLKFRSTSDSDYGIRVVMPDYPGGEATVRIYDDRE